MVYADSVTPVSADGFLFTRDPRYPDALLDFEKTFVTLETLPCDILITPHPEASGLWERLSRRAQGDQNALVDRNACRAYAENGRQALAARVARETESSR